MLRQSEEIRREGMRHYGFGIDAMKSIKICPSCGEMADAAQCFCTECGNGLPDENLYQLYVKKHRQCESCGTVVSKQMHYCPDCGQRLEA